jgi:murein L,D-transpeptidase YafK
MYGRQNNKDRHINMRAIWIILALLGGLVLTSCSQGRRITAPEITYVLVYKEARTLYLVHENQVVKSYPINLGFAPVGDKQREGDGKTPEGYYYIDRKNANSEFHLSLGISYPDTHHRATAREAGLEPGGDIFIHGGPNRPEDRNKPDWTAGCIAVSDREIEEIFSLVKVGTPIAIYP